jgi:hypothetical protein
MAGSEHLPETTPAGYEFAPSQNETIRSLAAAMRWVAIPLIIVGVFYASLAWSN